MASVVAAYPEVRAQLLDYQRQFARNHPAGKAGAILDGRDIGTVVFPDAPLKIYLTASSRARAERRLLELQAAGIEQALEEVQREIEARDEQDMSREIAPLKRAEDARTVDATALSLEEVVEACTALAREVFGS
jgi:cytidylate kinase